VEVYSKEGFFELIYHIFLALPHVKLDDFISFLRFKFFSLINAEAVGEGFYFLAYGFVIHDAHSSNMILS
jgi:hypothetical protein